MSKIWGSVTFDTKELESLTTEEKESNFRLWYKKEEAEFNLYCASMVAWINNIKACRKKPRCFRQLRSRSKRRF